MLLREVVALALLSGLYLLVLGSGNARDATNRVWFILVALTAGANFACGIFGSVYNDHFTVRLATASSAVLALSVYRRFRQGRTT